MKHSVLSLCVSAIMGLGVFSATFIPTPMHAQGVTSGGITGTVKAASGGVVAGAKIIAIHIPTGTRFGANAKSNGTFTIIMFVLVDPTQSRHRQLDMVNLPYPINL